MQEYMLWWYVLTTFNCEIYTEDFKRKKNMVDIVKHRI